MWFCNDRNVSSHEKDRQKIRENTSAKKAGRGQWSALYPIREKPFKVTVRHHMHL